MRQQPIANVADLIRNVPSERLFWYWSYGVRPDLAFWKAEGSSQNLATSNWVRPRNTEPCASRPEKREKSNIHDWEVRSLLYSFAYFPVPYRNHASFEASIRRGSPSRGKQTPPAFPSEQSQALKQYFIWLQRVSTASVYENQSWWIWWII